MNQAQPQQPVISIDPPDIVQSFTHTKDYEYAVLCYEANKDVHVWDTKTNRVISIIKFVFDSVLKDMIIVKTRSSVCLTGADKVFD